MSELSWKARKNGAVYCAPACGHRCTFKEYQAAKANGARLVKLLGKGWRVRVWENMGWFYEAFDSKRGLRVHQSGRGATNSYWASVKGFNITSDHKIIPQDAVAHLLALLNREILRLTEVARIAHPRDGHGEGG